MPIYEYACEKCHELTEVIQKVDDPAPAKCPHCGSKKMSRVVSRSAFHLKGGGWYSDLYGSSKGGATDTADKSTKPAKAAPAETPAKKPKEKATSGGKKD